MHPATDAINMCHHLSVSLHHRLLLHCVIRSFDGRNGCDRNRRGLMAPLAPNEEDDRDEQGNLDPPATDDDRNERVSDALQAID